MYSDNTVYADLAMMVGPENIAAAAHTMGIGSAVGANPSIALGGLQQGVTPLEMTAPTRPWLPEANVWWATRSRVANRSRSPSAR